MLNKFSKKITKMANNYTEYGYSTYDSATEVIEKGIKIIKKVLDMDIKEKEKIKFLEKSIFLLDGVFDSSLALMDNEEEENIRLLEDILIEIRDIYPNCCKREFQRFVNFEYDKLENIILYNKEFKNIKNLYEYLVQIETSQLYNEQEKIEFIFSSYKYSDLDKIKITLTIEEYINFKENSYYIEGLEGKEECGNSVYIKIERIDIDKYFNYQM